MDRDQAMHLESYVFAAEFPGWLLFVVPIQAVRTVFKHMSRIVEGFSASNVD